MMLEKPYVAASPFSRGHALAAASSAVAPGFSSLSIRRLRPTNELAREEVKGPGGVWYCGAVLSREAVVDACSLLAASGGSCSGGTSAFLLLERGRVRLTTWMTCMRV